MPRRPHRAAAALAAALALLGCPGSRRGAPPERFVAADAAAALVIPESGRAARELAHLQATLAGFPGAGELAEVRSALTAQLGFDPLDPEALAGAGLDPRRGIAVASLEPGGAGGGPPRGALVVLPVDDASKVEALLTRLARDRLGATERAVERHGAASVQVLRAPRGPAAALSWAIVDRSAILGAGPGGPAAVAAAATLAPEASLAEAAAWKTARRALGDAVAAVQWAPPGSPVLEGLWPVKDGLAVGVGAAPGRVSARAAVLLGAREPSFRDLAAGGAGAKALSTLDPDAQLAARWDGDPAALGRKLLPVLPAPERARLAARGIDLERDLLAVLGPGAAATISVAPGLDLGALSAGAARADPLRVVELEAILPVKDAAAAEAASARLAALAARPGGAPPPPAPGAVHRIPTPSGEIAWRVDAEGRRVVLAAGRPGKLDALAARLGAGGPGWRAATEGARAALSGGLGGAVLDPGRVVAAVRALPEEAFGSGPSAFVMRSLVDRVLDPAARLAAVSLRAELAEGALVLGLEVEAREARAEAPR